MQLFLQTNWVPAIRINGLVKKQQSLKPIDKVKITRNAIIALITMLILLLPLQAHACCDDIVTSQLALPPAAEQTLRPAQLIASPVNHLTAAQDSTKTEAAIRNPSLATDAQALELAAIVPASGSAQAATPINANINVDAAEMLSAIAGPGYIKIAKSGEHLDDQTTTWECVEDKRSNLTWEVKKNDGGIRDKDYSYSWLGNINGEANGVSNGGRCKGGVSCDTYSYVHAMNKQKLCSYSDWRLPTRKEMETLIDYKTTPKDATINKTYFPEAVPSWYWTATENPQRDNFAWYVFFSNGIALNDLKERPKHIRLVRGNQTQ